MSLSESCVSYRTSPTGCDCLDWYHNRQHNNTMCKHQEYILGIKPETRQIRAEEVWEDDCSITCSDGNSSCGDDTDQMIAGLNYEEKMRAHSWIYKSTINTCTCADFLYRKAENGDKCKHMRYKGVIESRERAEEYNKRDAEELSQAMKKQRIEY